MRWLIILSLAVQLIAASASARLDTPTDESRPELVEMYLFLPCDALIDSYTFRYSRLTHLFEHLKICTRLSKNNDYKYAKLMCTYLKMEWENMYDHIKSTEKAYEIMCDGEGRKNPEYDIDF